MVGKAVIQQHHKISALSPHELIPGSWEEMLPSWQALQQMDDHTVHACCATVIPKRPIQKSLGVFVDQKNCKCNRRHLEETPSRFLTG